MYNKPSSHFLILLFLERGEFRKQVPPSNLGDDILFNPQIIITRFDFSFRIFFGTYTESKVTNSGVKSDTRGQILMKK